jgi:nitrate reductase delta subunit
VKAQPAESQGAVVFQAASLLLDYPQPEAVDLTFLARAVAELPAGEARRRLETFLGWWTALTPRAREEGYVETFDLSAKASLYLTARRRGDKRYRGRELLALREEYRRHGLEASRRELPDYLPLMLEFAAAVPEGRRPLERERPALEELRRSLETLESPFQDVVAAVLDQLDRGVGWARGGRAKPRDGRPEP